MKFRGKPSRGARIAAASKSSSARSQRKARLWNGKQAAGYNIGSLKAEGAAAALVQQKERERRARVIKMSRDPKERARRERRALIRQRLIANQHSTSDNIGG